MLVNWKYSTEDTHQHILSDNSWQAATSAYPDKQHLRWRNHDARLGITGGLLPILSTPQTGMVSRVFRVGHEHPEAPLAAVGMHRNGCSVSIFQSPSGENDCRFWSEPCWAHRDQGTKGLKANSHIASCGST